MKFILQMFLIADKIHKRLDDKIIIDIIEQRWV